MRLLLCIASYLMMSMTVKPVIRAEPALRGGSTRGISGLQICVVSTYPYPGV